MDLSSSATQRSSTSEALSIQPGSVRVTTAMAANEFARHLAENARSDAGRRRDDRSAERAERAPRPFELINFADQSQKCWRYLNRINFHLELPAFTPTFIQKSNQKHTHICPKDYV